MFVSVKDAKPKRKVAVPIGDSTTWEQFCGQVLRSVPSPLHTAAALTPAQPSAHQPSSLPPVSCQNLPFSLPAQVQTKLKLMGIEAIYLASSGERIQRLDQLQDIDELYVVEVGPPGRS